jgi:uncharacterized protein (DUF2147 family)
MKRLIAFAMAFMCGTGLVCGEEATDKDPAEGLWLSVDNKSSAIQSGWELYQNNGVLYGKMLSAVGVSPSARAVKCKESYPGFPLEGKVNQMPLLGTPWIFGLRRERAGSWRDGYIIDPSNGNRYQCKITYHPADGKQFKAEALEMRGEIGLGIGGSQFWIRATREQIDALR